MYCYYVYYKLMNYALPTGTPGVSTFEVRKCLNWKAEFKSFPTIYDTPILLNIGMSYIGGKLLTSAFQCLEVRKRVTAYLLPASLLLLSTVYPFRM